MEIPSNFLPTRISSKNFFLSLSLWLSFHCRALLEAQEIFGLDFDPAEFDQLARDGLGSDEEGEEVCVCLVSFLRL